MTFNNVITVIKKSIINEYFLLFSIFLIFFLLRLYCLTCLVTNEDESIYFVVSQDIVHGGVPYKTTWDHKGPILYFLLAPIIWLFDSNIIALRLFTTIYIGVSMFFVYLIARGMFDRVSALIAPLVYGLFFTVSPFEGISSNAEIFMMLPLLIATFFFIKLLTNNNNHNLNIFLCGVFSSISIFIKATSLFSILVFPMLLIIKYFYFKNIRAKTMIKSLILFGIGNLLIALILISYFLLNNALQDFYYSYFVFNNNYVSSTPLVQGVSNFFQFINNLVRHEHETITIIALISAIFLLFTRSKNSSEIEYKYLIFLLALLSIIGVYWPRNMYNHYFLQMSLAFSLLITFAVSKININSTYLKYLILIILLMLIIMLPFGYYLHSFPEPQSKSMNSENKQIYMMSEYIKQNSSENDRILILGSRPIIHFLTMRKAPNKYFFWVHHYGRWRDILFEGGYSIYQFKSIKPKYIIYNKEFLKKMGCWRDRKFYA